MKTSFHLTCRAAGGCIQKSWRDRHLFVFQYFASFLLKKMQMKPTDAKQLWMFALGLAWSVDWIREERKRKLKGALLKIDRTFSIIMIRVKIKAQPQRGDHRSQSQRENVSVHRLRMSVVLLMHMSSVGFIQTWTLHSFCTEDIESIANGSSSLYCFSNAYLAFWIKTKLHGA